VSRVAGPILPAEVVDHVAGRTVELGRIPAPPLHEERRAEVVTEWWRHDELSAIRGDNRNNVWARLRSGGLPAIVVCAHLDTVFSEDTPHEIRREDDRLLGPGVGDDTVAVASLSVLDRVLPEQVGPQVWLLATAGEEGIGDLAGIRRALQHPPAPVGAVVAVEGNYLGRVTVRGVGSVRLHVDVTCPGGHAWEQAGTPSAVHVAAAAIGRLDALTLRPGARCSVNVGRLGGGEAINARARQAWFELDLRAEDPDDLSVLDEEARATIGSVRQDTVGVEIGEIGRRPAGGIDPEHRLVVSARRALEEAGIEPSLNSGSTDANAAYAAGIPAVTVGVTTGGLEHTPEEWIDIRPIDTGIRALARTIELYAGEGA
jgi:tripeptide aminopeptidase